MKTTLKASGTGRVYTRPWIEGLLRGERSSATVYVREGERSWTGEGRPEVEGPARVEFIRRGETLRVEVEILW